MGGALRSNNPLELTLAPPLWKCLLGARFDSVHDLSCSDERQAARLAALARCATQAAWPPAAEAGEAAPTWCVTDAAGRVRRAAPGRPPDAPVAWAERGEYVAAAAAAHAAAWRPAADAMRRGLTAELGAAALALLTWRQLERLVCGERRVTLPSLRAIIRNDLPPGAPQEPWLWQVLGELSDAQRGLLLAFATGRSRLPASPRVGQMVLYLMSRNERPTAAAAAHGGAAPLLLPRASTCSGVLHVPRARSLEQLREGVVYAITHCRAIDLDGDAGGGMFAALSADAGAGDADAHAQRAHAPPGEEDAAGGDSALLLPLFQDEAGGDAEEEPSSEDDDDSAAGDSDDSGSDATDGGAEPRAAEEGEEEAEEAEEEEEEEEEEGSGGDFDDDFDEDVDDDDADADADAIIREHMATASRLLTGQQQLPEGWAAPPGAGAANYGLF
jgi:hypothetical protein